jgi:hypothetical protein
MGIRKVCPNLNYKIIIKGTPKGTLIIWLAVYEVKLDPTEYPVPHSSEATIHDYVY